MENSCPRLWVPFATFLHVMLSMYHVGNGVPWHMAQPLHHSYGMAQRNERMWDACHGFSIYFSKNIMFLVLNMFYYLNSKLKLEIMI